MAGLKLRVIVNWQATLNKRASKQRLGQFMHGIDIMAY